MNDQNESDGTDYTKPLILFIFLLIVIAAGYFGLNVRFNFSDGFSIYQQSSDVKRVGIREISANPPDFIMLHNFSNEKASLESYMLVEGNKKYTFPEDEPKATLEAGANIKIYFLKEGNNAPDDPSALFSTAFRIKPGETIELIDTVGNVIDQKKAN